MFNTSVSKIKEISIFRLSSLIPRDPKILILLMLVVNCITIYDNNNRNETIKKITKLYVTCSNAIMTKALPSAECTALIDRVAKNPKSLPASITLTDIYALDQNIRSLDSTFPDISAITSGDISQLPSGKYYARKLYGW